MRHLEDMDIFELAILASQAKIPQIEYLCRQGLIQELEQNFYKSWNEVLIEEGVRVSNEFENKLLEIFEELLDEHFPKGRCKERGQAMVLVGIAILKINEIAELKTNSTGIDLTPDPVMDLDQIDWDRHIRDTTERFDEN